MTHPWKRTAMSGLFGVGVAMALSVPALADRSYTRCDGDYCRRVACDDDGDCRTVSQYYNPSGYDRNQGWYGNYDRERSRRWVCDSDGDCHWSYYQRQDRDDNNDDDE